MRKFVDPKYFAMVCSAIQATGAKTVIKIIDEKTVVKATYRFKPKGGNNREELVVTFGAPDYRTAQFIKRCKQAGEPFPVKKVQLRFWPKKKVK